MQTTDGTAAHCRAASYVERRIQQIALDADPHARTLASDIYAALVEYVDDLIAQGNTPPEVALRISCRLGHLRSTDGVGRRPADA